LKVAVRRVPGVAAQIEAYIESARSAAGLSIDEGLLQPFMENLSRPMGRAVVRVRKPTQTTSLDRTDVTIFNRAVAFRGENEASNPVTIFEFKKPQRDDFANPSSKEDPVQHIIRYVNLIREGKVRSRAGRDMARHRERFAGF